MKKQFNLDEWLHDKSRKVVTRDGREVEIYYNPNSRIPLIGRTSDNYVYQYTKDGFQCDIMNQAKNDLFFEEEEPEMTPFEKELMIDMDYYVHNLYSLGKTEEERIKWIKAWKPRLLEFASKELDTSVESDSSDFYTELAKAFDDAQHHTASDGYVFAKKYKEKFLELARKELEKDFPKWIPNKFEKRNWETCKAYLNTPRYLVHDDWMISVEELEKLPKEE